MPDALPAQLGGLATLVPLAAELCDLKRIRDASEPDSVASRMFRWAWGALAAGLDPVNVALSTTADAVAAARLGGIDRRVLAAAGVDEADALAILRRAFDAVAAPVDRDLADTLRDKLGRPAQPGPAPDFAEVLIRQPRAGATCPGKPRLVLEPPEGHGDHCLVVAVLAVLPDSGFTGEMLLGEHLVPVMERLFGRELATLPEALAATVRHSLETIRDAETPGGRAFHAADVIDRVLQMRHYDQVAHFTTSQALDDLDLVHAGPTQAFHFAVLRDAGLP